MLFAMLSTFNCSAFIPLAALNRARIIFYLLLLRSNPRLLNLGNFFDRLAIHVARKGYRLLHHFELPRDTNQTYRSLGRADVGIFDFSLINLDVGGIHGFLVAGVLEICVALLGENRRIAEVDQLELSQELASLVDAAIRRHVEWHGGFGLDRFSVLIEQRVTIAINEQS